MNSLTDLQPFLSKLFAQAEASEEKLRAHFGSLTPEERRQRMGDKSRERQRAFYAGAKDVYLAVSPETGRLLYLLARSCGARSVVEYGTSFGVSTLHLAAAVKDNGGGRVIGSEFEPSKVAAARKNLAAAGLDGFVEVREGDALDTLARNLPEQIDLVLLDGAKPFYLEIFNLLQPRLRKGALLVADNADASPDYLAKMRSEFVSVPFGADVELTYAG